jgi:glycosyltransferase involved in cell wall biosynthesis
MKIVVVGSLAWSLVNFRGALLGALAARGHEVIACAPDEDAEVETALAGLGVAYRRIPMKRASLSPIGDLVTLMRLVGLMRSERPDVVLAYTQKPIIYAGLATRIAGHARFHAMVSGLGHAFSEGGGPWRAVLRWVVALLFKLAVRRANSVIVFNRDDRAEMMRHGIISARHNVVQVPGSGVNTERFPWRPLDRGTPVFLLVARLMRDKGLEEYVAAARIVKAMAPNVRCRLLGPFDANPTGIKPAEVEAWDAEGIVEYIGETRDVAPHMAAATVIVLPSRYREGLPRTLLEAMSTGRAIITTDAPGCRETVEPGGNGFLMPVGDAQAFADAMMNFVCDPGLAVRMGRRSRELAEERFAVEKVNAILIRTLGLEQDSRPRSSRPASMIAERA